LVSVNLSEFILAAVLRYVALCILLRNILRKWFVTPVLTLPTCPATSQLCTVFLSWFRSNSFSYSALCQEVQHFYQKHTWKNSQIIFI